MSRHTSLPLSRVCDYFHVDRAVLFDFAEYGLYPTTVFGGELAIDVQYMDKLAEIVSLHRVLGINKEGIEVILELRETITGLQGEVESLRNENARLRDDGRIDEPETLRRLGLLIEIEELVLA